MPYNGETLERFWRDLKYLGAGDLLAEAHARFWIAQDPAGPDGAPAALQVDVDGASKPVWTSRFTKCGKVSSTGRVQPCLDMVLFNTGAGTPRSSRIIRISVEWPPKARKRGEFGRYDRTA
jgi:hypothetical protein